MYASKKAVLMVVTVAFATVCLGGTAFSLGFGGDSVVRSASSSPSDGQSRHPGKWMVDNYLNRISISAKEVDGEPCTELKLNRKDCDTQFSIRGDRFPVKGGSGFRMTFRVRGTYSLETSCGQWGRGGPYVGWYSVHACLRAYRQGNFYGAKRGLGELAFTRIGFGGENTVEAETDRPARFEVITAAGVVKRTETGTSVRWKMETPPLCGGSRRHMHAFVRVKAYALDGSGEELFSQPYMMEDEPRKV